MRFFCNVDNFKLKTIIKIVKKKEKRKHYAIIYRCIGALADVLVNNNNYCYVV